MKVQIFQRQILQLRPDGGVQTMNLLDEGLMPYTRMNGSTFPAPDQAIINQAPKPSDPNYHEKTLQFVRDIAPDTFEGEPVNFAKTFFSTVQLGEAYPNGVPDDGETLLPFFNLEIWGLPTSRPMKDPSNPSFIYQRFQRGIMHYDKSCSCTQGLLLADYFKAILTKKNLPNDLADQAKASKLLGQFAPGSRKGWRDRATCPARTCRTRFVGMRRSCSTPATAAARSGRAIRYPDGTSLAEKDLNLRVMLRVRDLLQQAGYLVTVTRTRDAQVNSDKKDLTADSKVTLSDDLQARVDAANGSGADVFVSVHFNGIADPTAKAPTCSGTRTDRMRTSRARWPRWSTPPSSRP